MKTALKNSDSLAKSLGFWDSVALVIGSVVGTGIFRTPSEVCRSLTDPGWVLFAWGLGGLIAFLGTLCYSELSSSFPQTGGTYVYLKQAYGPWAGFLFGWSELALMRAASMASVSYAFGEYFGNLFVIPGGVKTIAISAICLLTLINIGGLHYGKWLQNLTSLGKGIALTGLIVLGLFFSKGQAGNFATSFPLPAAGMSLSGFGLALVPILWTYGGWHESSFVAGEFKKTDTDLPFSLITATGLVITFYVIVNGVYLYSFPPESIAQRSLIAADVIKAAIGPVGEKVMTLVILVCIFGVLNTVILAGGRIPFALGSEHPIFSWLGKIHGEFQTPARSLSVNAIWAGVLVLWGSFRQLVFLYAAAVWLFFALTGIAVFVIRKRFKDKHRPFSLWGYPWTPILFTAAAGWIFLNTLFFSPRETLTGFSVIAFGLPLYWISDKISKRRPGT